MKYIPQFGLCWLRMTIRSPRSIGRFLPLPRGEGGEGAWGTAVRVPPGSRCSRSEAGGEGWWGDRQRDGRDRPERRAAAGADDWLKRNRGPNGWSATPHLVLRRRGRQKREINCSFSQILSLLSWLIKSISHAVSSVTNAQKAVTNTNRECALTLSVCVIRRRQ